MSTTCTDFLGRIQHCSLITLLHAKQVAIICVCSLCVVHAQLTHAGYAGGQGKQNPPNPYALPATVGIRETS